MDSLQSIPAYILQNPAEISKQIIGELNDDQLSALLRIRIRTPLVAVGILARRNGQVRRANFIGETDATTSPLTRLLRRGTKYDTRSCIDRSQPIPDALNC